jgi:hypothetical protein
VSRRVDSGTALTVRPARKARRGAIRLGLTQRGRLRRRVRFLRKQRELQLRDLGGLIFDMYRFGSKRQELVREKLRRMFEADRELREFEAMLGGRRRAFEVREPGVGGSCPRCLTLYSTDAHYCWRCGLALTEEAEARADAVVDLDDEVEGTERVEPEPEPQPEAEPEGEGPVAAGDANGSPNGATDEQVTTEIEAGRLTSRPADASRS